MTLLSAAFAFAPEVEKAGPPLEGGLVHRLDIGTSGVTLFAKTPALRAKLRSDFDAHKIEKRYLALTSANPLVQLPAIIEQPLIAAGKKRVRIALKEEEGWPARSEVSLVKRTKEGALVEVRTFTGRRHQVRVHLASIGMAILGDALYGDQGDDVGRLMLHAWSVRLADGRIFEAPGFQGA